MVPIIVTGTRRCWFRAGRARMSENITSAMGEIWAVKQVFADESNCTCCTTWLDDKVLSGDQNKVLKANNVRYAYAIVFGKDLTMLLSGSPGTGKMLTAKSVSEKSKVSLYSINAGDVGPSSFNLEECLKSAMDRCVAVRRSALARPGRPDAEARAKILCNFLGREDGNLSLDEDVVTTLGEASFNRY
ncbi:hypothetical protein ACJZ2D_013206 [Fusarium nematophilum]